MYKFTIVHVLGECLFPGVHIYMRYLMLYIDKYKHIFSFSPSLSLSLSLSLFFSLSLSRTLSLSKLSLSLMLALSLARSLSRSFSLALALHCHSRLLYPLSILHNCTSQSTYQVVPLLIDGIKETLRVVTTPN